MLLLLFKKLPFKLMDSIAYTMITLTFCSGAWAALFPAVHHAAADGGHCVHNVHSDLFIQEPGWHSFLLYIMLHQMEAIVYTKFTLTFCSGAWAALFSAVHHAAADGGHCVNDVHSELFVQEPGRHSFLLYIMLQQMDTIVYTMFTMTFLIRSLEGALSCCTSCCTRWKPLCTQCSH
jgi:hypothetical protein